MLKPVHALVGGDLFLQLDALAELLRAAGADVQRIDLNGETAQLADVLDELRSFAMFSSRKMVVVREADEFVSRFRESLENYVAKPVPDSTLVLRMESLPKVQRIYKLIAKTGQIHECEAPADVVGWIIRRAKDAHKLAISRDAAEVLFDLIGSDLGRLDNELAKLALQSEGRADAAAVRESASFQREQEMQALTQALAIGQMAEALRRWRGMVQFTQAAEFRAVTWLCMWLEDVYTFLTQPEAFRNTWRYKTCMREFQQTCRRIGAARAAELINDLAETDYRSKSGFGEMADNVERFLLSIQ